MKTVEWEFNSDMKHYHSLYRIGLTIAELKKIVAVQLKILFFVPFALAVLHSLFAMLAIAEYEVFILHKRLILLEKCFIYIENKAK
ncbi:hypothetical protein [Neobacillus cucumis]|uniref:hypothetical protein n=1 Tax=Neobacillus cucumis TaxID=1740721 RepID=UPI0028530E05|nr:hypothetical protein [Neobacillus cucumis]MDR4950456.1 hypothetical protein [Neobacillus cucumis]